MSAKELFSLREAAKILGIGRCNTLPKLIADGKITTVLIAGRVRISRQELERVMREGTEPQPVKRARRRLPPGEAEAAKLDALMRRR
jgi:excisionase family DNA binding protein